MNQTNRCPSVDFRAANRPRAVVNKGVMVSLSNHAA